MAGVGDLMHYYVNKKTGFFAAYSATPIEDPDLREVSTPPPDGNHKWTGRSWVVLTEKELYQDVEPDESPSNILTPPSEVKGNSLLALKEEFGEKRLIETDSYLSEAGSLKIAQVDAGEYLLKGEPFEIKQEPQKKQWSWHLSHPSSRITNHWLRQSGYVATNLTPLIIPHDCILHTVSLQARDDRWKELDSWEIQIYRSGQLYETYVKPQNETFGVISGRNTKYAAKDLLSIRAKKLTGTAISFPACDLYFMEM